MVANRQRGVGIRRSGQIRTGLLLALIAAGLRFYQLDKNGLWADEIFTALFSSPTNSLIEVISLPLATPLPTPPLLFIMMHAFLNLAGTSELAMRVPAVLAGVLAVVLLYRVGDYLFNERVGWIASGLLVVSPLHIFVSREARFYSFMVLLALASFYTLHRAIDTNRRRDWALFALISLGSIYLHLTAFFILAAETLYILLITLDDWRNRKNKADHCSWFAWLRGSPLASFLISGIIIGICYLPMVLPVIEGILGPRGSGNPDSVDGFEFSLSFVLNLFQSFSTGSNLMGALYTSFALWGIGYGISHYRRRVLFFALLLIIPFVIVIILSPKHWFAQKYVIFVLPAFLMMVAVGIQRFSRTAYRAMGALSIPPKIISEQMLRFTLSAVLFVGGLWFLDEAHTQKSDRWKEIAQLLDQNTQAGDVVIVLPLRILTMTGEELLDYYYSPSPQVHIIETADIALIEDSLGSYRRVWIIVDARIDEDASQAILTWLSTQDYINLRVEGNTQISYLGQERTISELLAESEAFRLPTAASYGSLGEHYLSLGEFEQAISSYEIAIALEPNEGIWHYELGIIYEIMGEPEQALMRYERAIKLQPKVSGFHAALAEYYVRHEQPEAAIPEYKKAIRLWRNQFRGKSDSVIVQAWGQEVKKLEFILSE